MLTRRDHNQVCFVVISESIGDFLEGFPSVRREQVLALLEESKAQALWRIVECGSYWTRILTGA